jgi:hypothetical protein
MRGRSSPPPQNSAKPPAIVLGARGKVGSTITSLLRAQGYAPVPIDRAALASAAAAAAAFATAPPRTPLWVCTTTDALGDALLSLPEDRRADCIVLQNGVLGSELRAAGLGGATGGGGGGGIARRGCTRVALYLRAGAAGADIVSKDSWEDGGGRTLVRPGGAHSEHAARVLPGARVAATRSEFLAAQRDKLAWACSAWLLSSGGGGGSGQSSAPLLTLGEVARGSLGADLRALAAELAAAAAAAAEGEEEEEGGASRWEEDADERERCAAAVVAYCESIAGAVPSRALALREWPWRNGAVVRAANKAGVALPLHEAWCERAGVGAGGAGGVGGVGGVGGGRGA